jgi:hypothetical protein
MVHYKNPRKLFYAEIDSNIGSALSRDIQDSEGDES